METATTCQFCERCNSLGTNKPRQAPLRFDGKVKYGLRHHAHFECFLERKGRAGFAQLHGWQQRAFPALLLKEWGLEKAAKEAR